MLGGPEITGLLATGNFNVGLVAGQPCCMGQCWIRRLHVLSQPISWQGLPGMQGFLAVSPVVNVQPRQLFFSEGCHGVLQVKKNSVI